MTWIVFIIAAAALGLSLKTMRHNNGLARALEKEQREKNELKTTLVEVLDEEGNIRGQLALPGHHPSHTVSKRLAIAERSVDSIQDEIRKTTRQLKKETTSALGELKEAKGALEASRSREDSLKKTLAEVVDSDGKVLAQLRLPGKKMKNPPNRTPCGDMCKLAFFVPESKNGRGQIIHYSHWRCRAGQDKPCDQARSQFLDADGQCVLWIRDDDVPLPDGTMPKRVESEDGNSQEEIQDV